MNRRFDIRTIGMMIIDGLIAIAFLFMPWLSAGAGFLSFSKSITGASGIFSLQKLLKWITSMLEESDIDINLFANETSGGRAFFTILTILPYVLLIGIVIGLIYLFLKNDQDQFCRWSRRWLWVDIAVIAVTRLMISMEIYSIVASWTKGEDYLSKSIGGSIADSVIKSIRNGLGMKLILIVCIVGIVAPWIIHLLDKHQVNIPAEIMEFDSTGFKKPGWVPHVYEVAASRPAVHDERPQMQRAPRRSRSEGGVMPSAPALRLEGDGFSIGIMRFPATIGSDPHEAAYDLPDSSISPVHCRIDRVNGQLAIMDLGSVKGTYLSEHRLPENQQYYLMDGDQIRLGNIEMTVRIGMR